MVKKTANGLSGINVNSSDQIKFDFVDKDITSTSIREFLINIEKIDALKWPSSDLASRLIELYQSNPPLLM